MSKQRKKKNNNKERQSKLALAISNKHGIVKVNNEGVEIFNINKYKRIPVVSQMAAKMMTEIPHRWVVSIVIDCTESNGKNKLVILDRGFSDRKIGKQLSEYLTGEYSKALDDCASKMAVNYAGWIAHTHRGLDVAEEGVKKLFAEFLDK